jgi:HPt (histidine-containing phosphotransfer) domain-containing protein
VSEAARLDPARLAEIDELERFQRGARAEVARLFVESIELDLTRVGDALAARDAESLRQRLHSIKGCAAGIGAAHLAAISAQLEMRARASDVNGVAQQLDALRSAAATAVDAVREWFRAGAAAPD